MGSTTLIKGFLGKMPRPSIRASGSLASARGALVALVGLSVLAVGAGAATGVTLRGDILAEIPITVNQALISQKPILDETPANRRFFSSTTDDQTRFNIVMDVYRGEVVEVTVPIVNRSTGSMVSVFSVVIPDVPSAVEGVPGLTLDVRGSGRVTDVAKVAPGEWTYTAIAGMDGVDNPGEPDGLTLIIKVAPTAMTGHFEITGRIRIVEL
jgi:hypothetical protein